MRFQVTWSEGGSIEAKCCRHLRDFKKGEDL